VDALVSHDAETFAAELQAVEKVRATRLEKRAALYNRIPAELTEEIGAAVGAILAKRGGRVIDAEYEEAGIGGFGVDPKDSARLLELREIIDEIGWPSFAAEEEADYPARLLQLAEERRSLARKWYAWDGDAEVPADLLALLSQIHGEVANPHPDPLPEDGARAVKRVDFPELDPVPPAFRQPVPPPKPGERIEVVRK
jgi:hypothetical protein